MCTFSSGPALRRLLAGAAIVFLAACDSAFAPRGVPAELRLVSGDTQAAVAGQALTRALEVRALNADGEPVPQVRVAFAVGAGGGYMQPGSTLTDGGGFARAVWTLGPRAGVQTAQVGVTSGALPPVTFTARATPGPPARLVPVSGDTQSARVTQTLPRPLVMQVQDAMGNGVPGVPVTWEEEVGHGGVLVPGASLTDSAGEARAVWTIGTRAGGSRAVAHAAGGSVEFHAWIKGGAAVRVVVNGDSIVTLHPSSTVIWASAWDRYDNTTDSAGLVVWSSSDPGVAVVNGEAGAPLHGVVSTRGRGTARIHASIDGQGSGERRIHVLAAVEGPYRPILVGPSLDAVLTNEGGVVTTRHWGPEPEVEYWRDGQTTRWVGLPWPFSQWGGWLIAINDAGWFIIRGQTMTPHDAYENQNSSLVRLTAPSVDHVTLPDDARDVNNSNVVVGGRTIRDWWSGSYYQRGYVWTNGQLTELRAPVASEHLFDGQTWAAAINDRGDVAVNIGQARFARPQSVRDAAAYVWRDGGYTSIPRPDPACQGWIGEDINDHGAVALTCGLGSGGTAAYLWDGTRSVSMAPMTLPATLNDRGEVVGIAPDGLYLWRAGRTSRLIGVDSARIAGRPRINDAGQIIFGLRGFGTVFLQPDPAPGGWSGARASRRRGGGR